MASTSVKSQSPDVSTSVPASVNDTRPKSFTFSKSLDNGIAGFLAGAVSTAILHPLDLVKTRFQGTSTKSPSTLP
jgi:solute carrier family 25 folate transporter 32